MTTGPHSRRRFMRQHRRYATVTLAVVATLLGVGCDGDALLGAQEPGRASGAEVAAPSTPPPTTGSTSTTSSSTTLPTTTVAEQAATTAGPPKTATTSAPKPPRTTVLAPESQSAPSLPQPAPTAAPTTVAPPPPTQPPPTAPPAPAGPTSSGWLVTVYFTPRESNHQGGSQVSIDGCPVDYCRAGEQSHLGTYRSAFLERVRQQGTGLITSGAHTGKYLNWSSGVSGSGYWLASVPKSASGQGLVGRQSAASPSLSFGTQFVIADCGHNAYGGQLNQNACAELRNTTWRIIDRFEPWAAEGDHHLDLYLGVEAEGQLLENSHLYLSWANVTITQV